MYDGITNLNENAKIVHDLLEIWLDLLDDGLGGSPTPKDIILFKKIGAIIPKELRNKRLKEFQLELMEDK